MSILDLSRARSVYHDAKPVSEIWHDGQRIYRYDPFPVWLFEGDYIHFAAEDADGETWQSRHGLPVTLERSGTPELVDVNGAPWLNTTNGCYSATIQPQPAEAAFSLWALSVISRSSAIMAAYLGPPGFADRPDALRFTLSSQVSAGNGRYHKVWTLPPYTSAESLEWLRPAGLLLSEISLYQNGVVRSGAVNVDREIAADGSKLVIGGEVNSAGVPQPRGAMIRDIILTRGWTLSETQRQALEEYRLNRI